MLKAVGRVSLVFFIFSSLLAINAFAQNPNIVNENYLVPNPKDSISLLKLGYYISEIKDIRTTKPNNGSYALHSQKHPIIFKDSLSVFLSSFIFPNKKENATLKPLRIEIEKLKCFTSSSGIIDEGQLYVKFNFYDSTQGIIIHTFERTLNSKKKTNPEFISDLIFTACKISISGLKKQNTVVNYNSTETKTGVISYTNETPNTEKVTIPADKTYKIPFPKTKQSWNNNFYYISDIKDIRVYNQTDGNLLVGYFNLKTQAKLNSNLEYYFKQIIDTSYQTNKTPLKLYINTFHCKEVQTPDGERGTLLLSANLVKDSAGMQYSIFKRTIEIDTLNENDLTKYWPEIISESISQLLANLVFTTPVPFEIPQKQSVTFNRNNTEIAQIITEYSDQGTRYMWKGKELTKLKDFNEPFESIYNTEAYQKYYSAKALIRTSRITFAASTLLLTYALTDYLMLEQKSIKKWYNASVSESSKIMPIDKKIIIWTGATSLVSSIICKAIGKSQFAKAIGMHNKTLAQKITINYAPDLFNQGHQLQLNIMLGQR